MRKRTSKPERAPAVAVQRVVSCTRIRNTIQKLKNLKYEARSSECQATDHATRDFFIAKQCAYREAIEMLTALCAANNRI